MASIKVGFDYTPINYRKIMTQPEIMHLNRLHPSGGFIYLDIYLRCFEDNGYFVECSKSLIWALADMTGKTEEDIRQVVGDCIELGLFDAEIYKACNILTSVEIQKKFIEMSEAARRKSPKIDSQLDLLNAGKCGIIPNNAEECNIIQHNAGLSRQSKGKETKVKEKNVADATNSAHTRADIIDNSAIFKHTEDENIHIVDLGERLKAESVWVEALCMNLHKDRNYILQRLDEFCTELQMQGVTTKPLADAKKHFSSWLRKVEQIETTQGQATNRARLIDYDQMLYEISRQGGSTDDYEQVKVNGQTKPLWRRRSSKQGVRAS